MCLDTSLPWENVFKELGLQQSDIYIQFSRILIKFDICLVILFSLISVSKWKESVVIPDI